jgi:hypothetical protein
MRDIFDGAVVAFECLGDIHVAEHRFLDAITDQGVVKLSPSFDPPFTGARWQCMSQGGEPGSFALVSAGAVHGFRYLDGRTQDGFVHTVGDTLAPFSGTRWHIQELSPGVVTILSRGDFDNPQHKFLDGRTQVGDGSVGLAPNTNPPFSGTKWGTIPLPAPSLEVQTQRTQTGAQLTMRGKNFTPKDDVRFTAEGIVGHGGPNHSPSSIGGFAIADDTGSFVSFAEISFVPTQPGDLPVTIRATDHHGRTANGFTFGFAVP